MCGIWAQVKFDEPVIPEELLHPIHMLSHRGPDGYGWYCQDHVALVHTRLSIIDLLGGAQPLQGSNKNIWAVINGELYDYQTLRDELREQGMTFQSESDSEVLLNLFCARGSRGLASTLGEYAFIFYDSEKRKIFFGRDLHGVKPLFFEWTSQSFTLSSETKALSSQAPVLDEVYVNRFIARTMVAPRTAIKGAHHVLPGRVYTFDIEKKQLTFENFQSLPLFQERILSKTEAIEQTRFELTQSVRRRLVADVEVGCYLSGGIDSALVAALAVQVGAKPRAFTVGFLDRDFDESQQAAEIARHLGIPHSTVMMSGKNFFSYLIQSIVAFENPITNIHGAAKNLLSSHASKSVKVVLSGEGADEWFGGYAYLRIQKLQKFARQHPLLAKNALSLFLSREMGSSMKHLDGTSTHNDSVIRKYFAGQVPAGLSRLSKQRLYEHVTRDSFDSMLGGVCEDLLAYLQQENPHFSGRTTSWDLNSWMALRTDLLHYILANVGDRQEMSHSLEGRTPFLDPKVVAVAARTRETALISGLTEKSVLKNLIKEYLPPHLRQVRKQPFFAPMKYLYLREVRQAIQDYIQVAEAGTPWLNWKHLRHLLTLEELGSRSPLDGSIISLKLTLFSLGVLLKELRQYPVRQPRGYRLPKNREDLKPYRRGSYAI